MQNIACKEAKSEKGLNGVRCEIQYSGMEQSIVQCVQLMFKGYNMENRKNSDMAK